MKDYYKILGVNQGATLSAIKEAYRKQSKKYHPDQNKSKNAKNKQALVKEAYKVLSDASKRKEYDMNTYDNGVGEEKPVIIRENKISKKKASLDIHSDKIFRIIATVIGIIAVIGGLFLVSELAGKSIKDTSSKKELITSGYTDFANAVNSSSKKVVLIGRPDCTWCVKFKPILQKVAGTYNLDILDINISEFTSEEQAKYLKVDTDSAVNGIGTPILLLISDGKIIDRIDGYVEQPAVETFLRKNKIIAS